MHACRVTKVFDMIYLVLQVNNCVGDCRNENLTQYNYMIIWGKLLQSFIVLVTAISDTFLLWSFIYYPICVTNMCA